MKNILLITWLGWGNFGTCLQSYALNTKLNKLGYNVSFVLTIPKKFGLYGLLRYIKYMVFKNTKKKKINNRSNN